MKKISALISLAIILMSSDAISEDDKLCGSLKAFVQSVAADTSQSLELQTSWGGGFKKEKESIGKEEEIVLYEKRCNFHEYEPAEKVCDILMRSSSTEFPHLNLKRVLACLSPGTKFSKNMEIGAMSVSFDYGDDERGSFIYIDLGFDSTIGGNQLKIVAEGY
ncbi:hypothetical protein EMM73_13730 [Rheinheimera sediminis]|uniref:hypothetical protein n=1 Tax=Rheinheimera sp. YQF-1 TaxID=2499626 RepID=UPI000FD70EFA|nr:hypothetical protein [Rheinheimera sp. YQF-1]RVT45311.1 hypothetical protein EMM73_13730 [Rheinheimera sp. YQF-1]